MHIANEFTTVKTLYCGLSGHGTVLSGWWVQTFRVLSLQMKAVNQPKHIGLQQGVTAQMTSK
jgi:hypothetical protein